MLIEIILTITTSIIVGISFYRLIDMISYLYEKSNNKTMKLLVSSTVVILFLLLVLIYKANYFLLFSTSIVTLFILFLFYKEAYFSKKKNDLKKILKTGGSFKFKYGDLNNKFETVTFVLVLVLCAVNIFNNEIEFIMLLLNIFLFISFSIYLYSKFTKQDNTWVELQKDYLTIFEDRQGTTIDIKDIESLRSGINYSYLKLKSDKSTLKIPINLKDYSVLHQYLLSSLNKFNESE